MSTTTVARSKQTPSTLWTRLAMLTHEVGALQDSIELHRSAVVGALHEAHALKVPAEDVLPAFVAPVLASLGDLGFRANTLHAQLADVLNDLRRDDGPRRPGRARRERGRRS